MRYVLTGLLVALITVWVAPGCKKKEEVKPPVEKAVPQVEEEEAVPETLAPEEAAPETTEAEEAAPEAEEAAPEAEECGK
ncbi:MAG TPA: hypothetical protein EYP53_08375 [Candidatus Latescibacteria bacterium]|nr:hypothetical protein [Candidatus Latescibacterota bacterium]